MKEKLQVNESNAERMWTWLMDRGGIAVWSSINLANPGASWRTPAFTDENPPVLYPKPNWQVSNTPQIITDPAEVEVTEDEEVNRFHVAVRMSSNGLTMKVTDGGSRRIKRAVAKAGEGAYYEFDDETQEAVIYRPKSVVPIADWISRRKDLASLQKAIDDFYADKQKEEP